MMNELAMSFAALVKNNDGLFKSDKQAQYLLSQCEEENMFTTSGTVYRSPFTMFYHCDEKGVVKVEKYLPRTSKTEVVWLRPVKGTLSIKDAKHLAQLKRMLKQTQNKVKDREAAWERGEYASCPDLFNQAMDKDLESMIQIEAEIAKLV